VPGGKELLEQRKDCGPTLLDLPEDIFLLIFRYLPPKDLVSLECSSAWLRGLIVYYSVYKTRLDLILIKKRLNNYMVLSEAACKDKSMEDISGYYKTRLCHYIHRVRLKPIEEERDDYIITYKVGKKKQELDDLVARNIQRGRDHGLPGFCCYYVLYDDPNHDCNQGWNRRYHGISQQNWDLLQTIYDHPNDIDLFTGALAQDAHNGALSGKVFLEMKKNQFERTKDGDRFFFTHKDQAGGFTKEAREILINRTLGGVICDNTGISAVPSDVFTYTGSTKSFVDCNSASKLDGSNINELLKGGGQIYLSTNK